MNIIPIYGGKHYCRKAVVSHLFYSIGDYYCEPFVGAGSILLELKQMKPNLISYVGDLDDQLANLWMQIFNGQFATMLPLVEIMSEEVYQQLKEERDYTPLQAAIRYYYLLSHGFRGKGVMGIRRKGGDNRTSQRDWQTIFSLLQKVFFFHADYKETIALALDKSKNRSFIYCDPPYYGTEKISRGEGFDHQAFHDYMVGLPKEVHWAISYNDCPEIRALYAGHVIIPIEYQSGMKYMHDILIKSDLEDD